MAALVWTKEMTPSLTSFPLWKPVPVVLYTVRSVCSRGSRSLHIARSSSSYKFRRLFRAEQPMWQVTSFHRTLPCNCQNRSDKLCDAGPIMFNCSAASKWKTWQYCGLTHLGLLSSDSNLVPKGAFYRNDQDVSHENPSSRKLSHLRDPVLPHIQYGEYLRSGWQSSGPNCR